MGGCLGRKTNQGSGKICYFRASIFFCLLLLLLATLGSLCTFINEIKGPVSQTDTLALFRFHRTLKVWKYSSQFETVFSEFRLWGGVGFTKGCEKAENVALTLFCNWVVTHISHLSLGAGAKEERRHLDRGTGWREQMAFSAPCHPVLSIPQRTHKPKGLFTFLLLLVPSACWCNKSSYPVVAASDNGTYQGHRCPVRHKYNWGNGWVHHTDSIAQEIEMSSLQVHFTLK